MAQGRRVLWGVIYREQSGETSLEQNLQGAHDTESRKEARPSLLLWGTDRADLHSGLIFVALAPPRSARSGSSRVWLQGPERRWIASPMGQQCPHVAKRGIPASEIQPGLNSRHHRLALFTVLQRPPLCLDFLPTVLLTSGLPVTSPRLV